MDIDLKLVETTLSDDTLSQTSGVPVTLEEFYDRYDLLYELLVDIQDNFSLEQFPLPPLLNSVAFNTFEGQYLELARHYQQFENEFHILSQELVINELKALLRPIYIRMQSMEKILELSITSQAMLNSIEKILKDIHGFFQNLNRITESSISSSDHLEESLEDVLDSCAFISEQIDDLSSEEMDLTLLEIPFEKLLVFIQSLEERLEEL